MKAKHVHYANRRKSYFKKIRTLRHYSTYQQSAIACAANGNFLTVGIFSFDQKLCDSYKIIKYILFFIQHTSLVPFFTILTAAPEINYRINTALLNEKSIADTE